MTYKKITILVSAFALNIVGISQTIIFKDPSFSAYYRAEVKSLDEFAARFNGEESHPDIQQHKFSDIANLCALFDTTQVKLYDNNGNIDPLITKFCTSVLQNNIRFSMSNTGVFALADCIIKYKTRICQIKLHLKQERMDNGYLRWGIVAVSGLNEAGIIKAKKLLNISPVEHEVHFMGLNDILNNNPQNAFGYINSTVTPDQLSVFMALTQEKLIKFDHVEQLHIYCADVDGFIFKIDEINRLSQNSGWLITELITATPQEKVEFINNLANF